MKIHRRAVRIVGGTLASISIAFAATMRFNHFYELLMLGLFLVFYSTKALKITRKTYASMYGIFVGSGFVGDYLMGVHQGKLWRYPSFSVLDFLLLYAIAYPLAGIVMVQSYSLILHILNQKHLTPKIPAPLSIRVHGAILCALLVVFVGTTAEAVLKPNQLRSSLSYVAAALLATAFVDLLAAYRKRLAILDIFWQQPFKAFTALLVATYGNAILQELPNTYAHEWVYVHYPLAGAQILAIPISILCAWPVLLLFPLSVYCLVTKDRSLFDIFQEQLLPYTAGSEPKQEHR